MIYRSSAYHLDACFLSASLATLYGLMAAIIKQCCASYRVRAPYFEAEYFNHNLPDPDLIRASSAFLS